MKSHIAWLVVLVLGVFFVLHWTDAQLERHDREARARESLLKARVAEAETQRVVDSVEVVKRVTITKALRDTLNIHDTIQVKEYLTQTDTLRIACLACPASASQFKKATDSLADDYRERLRNAEGKSFWRRFGVYAGYGISGGQDNAMRHGPTIGVGVRIWP